MKEVLTWECRSYIDDDNQFRFEYEGICPYCEKETENDFILKTMICHNGFVIFCGKCEECNNDIKYLHPVTEIRKL